MRIRTTYICGRCGNEFTSRESAEKCEATHKEPLKVDVYSWRTDKDHGLHPHQLIAQFDDNSEALYELREVEDSNGKVWRVV